MNRDLLFFVFKVIVSGFVIAFSSWLAGRRPALAGFLVALPMISLLSIPFSYLEYRDMQKINQFGVAILTAVPLSLLFFLPFVLNRWLKMSFVPTYVLAVGLLGVGYCLHHYLEKYGFFR